jgi:hypothetical protein
MSAYARVSAFMCSPDLLLNHGQRKNRLIYAVTEALSVGCRLLARLSSRNTS